MCGTVDHSQCSLGRGTSWRMPGQHRAITAALSPAGMKRGGKVALDGALREAKKYAAGGKLNQNGLGNPANHVPQLSGMLNSSIPGRTDKLPINVKAGSYVLPSDVVSALGEGNSAAGRKMLDHMAAQYAQNAPQQYRGAGGGAG